jgi:hypothetical protein
MPRLGGTRSRPRRQVENDRNPLVLLQDAAPSITHAAVNLGRDMALTSSERVSPPQNLRRPRPFAHELRGSGYMVRRTTGYLWVL